jgi:hypothetical protein
VIEVCAEDRGSTLGALVWSAVAASGVGLFYTSLDLYANEAWGAPAPGLLVLAFVAAATGLAATAPDRAIAAARAPLVPWLVGFFALTSAWAVFATAVPGSVGALVERYRAMLFLLAFLVVFQPGPGRRAAALALCAGVVLATAMNVAEALGLVQLFPFPGRVAGRSSGLYDNTNAAGLDIALGLAAALGCVPRRWRVSLVIVGAVGVALTFSRSSVLAFAAMLVAVTSLRVVRLGRLVAVALLVGAILVWFSQDAARMLEDTGVLNDNTWSRLRLAADDSGRIEVARRAWELFLRSPLIGNGIGATSDWDVGIQTHNEYLFFAADHGLLGFLVVPAAALALALGGRAAIPVALVLLVAGVFSHGLFSERPILTVIAFAGAGRSVAPRDADADASERDAGT